MKSVLNRMICRFLAVALLLLPFQGAQAGMIGSSEVIGAASAQADRGAVLSFLSRNQTVRELQRLGLDAQAATERVAAMTDDEAGALAGKINALPAGADGGGLVLILVIVFAIWWFAYRR